MMNRDQLPSEDSEDDTTQPNQMKVKKQKQKKKKKKLYVSDSDEDDTYKNKYVKKKETREKSQANVSDQNENSSNNKTKNEDQNDQFDYKPQQISLFSSLGNQPQALEVTPPQINIQNKGLLFSTQPKDLIKKDLSKEKPTQFQNTPSKFDVPKIESSLFGKDKPKQKDERNEYLFGGEKPKSLFGQSIFSKKQSNCQNTKLHSILLGTQISGCSQLYNQHLLSCIECRDKLMKKCLAMIEKISTLNRQQRLGGISSGFSSYLCLNCKSESQPLSNNLSFPNIKVPVSQPFNLRYAPNSNFNFRAVWNIGLQAPLKSLNTKIDKKHLVKCITLKSQLQSLTKDEIRMRYYQEKQPSSSILASKNLLEFPTTSFFSNYISSASTSTQIFAFNSADRMFDSRPFQNVFGANNSNQNNNPFSFNSNEQVIGKDKDNIGLIDSKLQVNTLGGLFTSQKQNNSGVFGGTFPRNQKNLFSPVKAKAPLVGVTSSLGTVAKPSVTSAIPVQATKTSNAATINTKCNKSNSRTN